ncbi:HET-domain-containing protein [Hypoxylon crocopeplum]|nr:HET-domain-containing protein [Hypoxylon crocopeplum]
MWLLHVYTRKLTEYVPGKAPSYAILSHTWGKDEVTFQDLSSQDYRHPKGYSKIEGCCRQAAKDGLQYVWIDTCCINKSSSAELTEGINSMFQWYKKSAVCYVYLSDVSTEDDPFKESSEFRRSRWFSRGWTLQELLAPTSLAFFDKSWNEAPTGRLNRPLGQDPSWFSNFDHDLKRPSLLGLLYDITGIPRNVLSTGDFSQFCAAARLAWAADRETTRVEDRAYSLLGLLEVNMSLLYGEGNKAFLRLQEEVIKSRDDDSLLAWGYRLFSKEKSTIYAESVLAESPFYFKNCHSFQELKSEEAVPGILQTTSHSAMTSIGMQMARFTHSIDSRNEVFIAILRCHLDINMSRSHLVIPLVRNEGGITTHFSRAPGSVPFLIHESKLFPHLNVNSWKRWRNWRSWRSPSWELLAPIYIRASPTTKPPLLRLKSREGYTTTNLYIDEVLSAGYEVASFYPPWISRMTGSRSCLELPLGKPGPTRFMVIFWRPKGIKLSGNLFFAVDIGLDASHVGIMNQGTALEYLMGRSRSRSRSLEVDMGLNDIQQETLELNVATSDGRVRCVDYISLQHTSQGIRIKCSVTRIHC